MTSTTFGRAGASGVGEPDAAEAAAAEAAAAEAAAAAMAVSTGLATALAGGMPAPLALLQATVSAASAAGPTAHAPLLPPGSPAR
jgi:hypothetical protein